MDTEEGVKGVPSPNCKHFDFSIDRGGTFTDIFAEFLDGDGFRQSRVLKILSVDPSNYPDAPREGIRRILEWATGIPHSRALPLDTSRITSIRMGTTVCCYYSTTNISFIMHPCISCR